MGSNRRRTEMASKKHKPEQALAKLRQVDVLVSQGQTVAEAIRAIGVTEVTYYRWRREFGGLKSDQGKRVKELEAENARTRRGLAGERQAGGADLAPGGAEGAAAPAPARTAVAGRRLLPPAAAGAAEPRLELRLHGGPHP